MAVAIGEGMAGEVVRTAATAMVGRGGGMKAYLAGAGPRLSHGHRLGTKEITLAQAGCSSSSKASHNRRHPDQAGIALHGTSPHGEGSSEKLGNGAGAQPPALVAQHWDRDLGLVPGMPIGTGSQPGSRTDTGIEIAPGTGTIAGIGMQRTTIAGTVTLTMAASNPVQGIMSVRSQGWAQGSLSGAR